MNMDGVSIIGWLHSIVATLSILVGAVVLFGTKGTPRHRFLGKTYFVAMIAANVSSLGIYHFDIASFAPFRAGPGVFGLFHWESIFTLAFLLLGFYAASRQRRALFAYLHPVSMLITYYMLTGGLVNELFVRVPFIRALGRQAATLAQTGAMMVFVALLVWSAVKVALYRRRTAIAL